MAVIKEPLIPMEDGIDDHDNYSCDGDDDHDHDHDDLDYFHINHQTNIVYDDDTITSPLDQIPSDNQHHHGSTDPDQQNINRDTPDLPPPSSPPPPPPLRRYRPLSTIKSREIVFLFFVALVNVTHRGIPALTEWRNPFPTPSFHVDSLTITYFDISTASSTLSANWDIGFSTGNPSKKMACYSHLEAVVYHGDALLSATAMNPFCHEPGAKTVLNATSSSSQMIIEDSVATQILRDQKIDNPVAFNVKIKGKAQKCTELSSETRYGLDASCQDKYYKLDVSCKDVHATVGKYWGKGRMSGEPKQCNVVVSAERHSYQNPKP